MKNQNQPPPAHTSRAPRYQSCGRKAGVGVAGVGYQNTMTTVATT